MMKNKYDIAVEMCKYLDIEKVARNEAINEALSNLDKAAEILDVMGKYRASEVITKLMERIPSALNKGS